VQRQSSADTKRRRNRLQQRQRGAEQSKELRLRNPFKHNARVQTTAFPFIRAEFANKTRDGGGRTTISYTFLVVKIQKERPSAQTQSFPCIRVGVNCIPILFMKNKNQVHRYIYKRAGTG
jgi:hypothetical protein